MVINNLKKSKIKVLIDTEDLKNSNISLTDWMKSPQENLDKLFQNLPQYKGIIPKDVYIYSYKFILFYIFIEY